MRPQVLRVQGLRSYVSEEIIDFRDRELVAIVGDTGAGKSSILEAICFALYGTSSWDKKASKELIAHGADVMRVELEFVARGRTWTIRRTASRTSYPQPIIELRCDELDFKLDGKRAVDAKIEELIGLERDAFLRTVILPQGRFQRLLQATPAERTGILKGIFGFDMLEQVRAWAEECVHERRPQLDTLQGQRRALLDDPAAEADRAREEIAALAPQIEALQEAGRACREASERAERAAQRAGRLDSARRALDTADWEELGAAIDGLLALRAEIENKQRDLAQRVESLRGEREALKETMQSRDAAGLGLAGLVTALADLKRLGELVERVARGREELTGLDRAVDERAEQSEQRDREVTGAEGEVERAGEAARDAEEAADGAMERKQRATELLSAYRDARALLDEAVEAIRASEGQLRDAEELCKECARTVEEARARKGEADEQLERARDAHAAAALAAHLGPGDACPVCRQAVPTDFVAPKAADVDAARAAVARAKGEVEAAERAHREAEKDREALEKALREQQSTRDEHRRTRDEHGAALEELLGEFAPEADDQTLMAALTAECTRAEERIQDATKALARAKERLQAAQEAAREQASQLAAATAERDAKRKAIEADEQQVHELVAAVPEELRPGAAEAAAIAAAQQRAEERRQAVEADQARLDELTETLERLGQDAGALDRRMRREVDEPARDVRYRLSERTRALAELAEELDCEPIEALAEGANLAEMRAFAQRLGEHSRAALGDAARAHDALIKEREAAERAARDALARAECTTLEQVNTRIGEIKAKLASAQARHEQAQEQIAPARDLDARIATAEKFLQAVDELRALLSDGKFVGYAVEHKQRALLEVASRLLSDMTGNRFGFAPDFSVVDKQAGESRAAKTLSGGESFLASLALALGLVELAHRAGGRLDALFLDEGFGSLDAEALDLAIEALMNQAESGRLVVVISHLQAVAENIDDVLLVASDGAGSKPRWLGRHGSGEHDRTGLLA